MSAPSPPTFYYRWGTLRARVNTHFPRRLLAAYAAGSAVCHEALARPRLPEAGRIVAEEADDRRAEMEGRIGAAQLPVADAVRGGADVGGGVELAESSIHPAGAQVLAEGLRFGRVGVRRRFRGRQSNPAVGQRRFTDAARALASGLEGKVDLEEDLADYEARENTFAGYGLVGLDLGSRSQFLAGARYEYIDVDYTSRQLLFNAAGELESVTPTDGTNDYAFFLPMLHLRYEVAPDANVRTALTRSFARPNFEDVVPFRLIRPEENLVELGNAELRPTEAWNVDVLGEKYFSTVGVLSAGFFYKTLSDTIFISRDVQEIGGETFDVIQPRNLDHADLVGLEGALQNTLRFLPSPLDGLTVFANYTYTNSSADIPGREGMDNRLPGQAENVGNFAIFYEKYGFSSRLSWNYVSEYLFEVGGSPERNLFIDSHVQLDLALSQRVARQWMIFAEFINLTDEPLRVYEGTPDRPIQVELYSWWATFGIKWNF